MGYLHFHVRVSPVWKYVHLNKVGESRWRSLYKTAQNRSLKRHIFINALFLFIPTYKIHMELLLLLSCFRLKSNLLELSRNQIYREYQFDFEFGLYFRVHLLHLGWEAENRIFFGSMPWPDRHVRHMLVSYSIYVSMSLQFPHAVAQFLNFFQSISFQAFSPLPIRV